MTAKKNYGRARSGKVITDELIDEYVKQAEDGLDVDELIRRRGGRPLIGEAPATVESVRLEPELRDALRERAERDGRTNSDVIREALRRYLQAS
ncbi:MAG: YlcI/YnfO family protein [Jatrophihabitans sp.]